MPYSFEIRFEQKRNKVLISKGGNLDAAKSTEVIVTLSAESKKKVNVIVNKALAAGSKPSNNFIDQGFMYIWMKV